MMIHPSMDAAIAHAMRSWTTFAVTCDRKARLAERQVGTAADGSLLASFEVIGKDTETALTAFAGMPEFFRPMEPDDLRPFFDYSVPGREACVWRTGGVWVELWRPDTASAVPAVPEPVPAPVPVQAAPKPSPRGLLGGQLPFARTRRQETTA